jgi:hypothetical protein
MSMDRLLLHHDAAPWWERGRIERAIIRKLKAEHREQTDASPAAAIDIVTHLGIWQTYGRFPPILTELLGNAAKEIERLRSLALYREKAVQQREDAVASNVHPLRRTPEWTEFDDMAEDVADSVIRMIRTRDDAIGFAMAGTDHRSILYIDNFADALMRRVARERARRSLEAGRRQLDIPPDSDAPKDKKDGYFRT